MTVTYPDGSTKTVVAGPDGTWTVPNPGLNDGDEVTAVATDPAGNTSDQEQLLLMQLVQIPMALILLLIR